MKIAKKQITIIIVTMFVLTILSMLSYSGLRMTERNTPLIDAAMEIKYELSLFHLWFEELVSGDSTLTKEEIWQHLEQSQWYINAMLEGGKNTEGIYVPLDDPKLRTLIKSTYAATEILQQTANLRLKNIRDSLPGSDIDQEFDLNFQLALSSADKVETELQKLIQNELTQYRILSLALAISVIFIAFFISYLFNQYDKNKSQLLSQLSNANKDLEYQVDKRTHELNAALKHEEHANQAKSEFLSSMSHELRTPLNAILGFAQLLLLDRTSLNSNQTTYINEIKNGGTHLLALVNDVLDLSKMEKGTLEISNKILVLQEILDECFLVTKVLADLRDIKVEFENANEIKIYADPVRIKQALLNLLSNAVKYNRSNGYIHLYCEIVDNQKLRIYVKDNGYGLSEEKIEHIFQSFVRVGTTSSGIEGAGMGLAITKNLIELMGGSAGVTSKIDEGCTFWLELEYR